MESVEMSAVTPASDRLVPGNGVPVSVPALELFAQVFATLGDAVLVVDDTGRIVVANARVGEVFGYEPGALVGRSVEDLVPEPLREAHARSRAGYGATSHARPLGTDLDLQGLRADGTVFPADISLSPLQSLDGMLTVAVVRDLTARHAAEERKANLVLAASLDAYLATDVRGLVTEWNRAAEATFGWSREEALGRPLAELIIPQRLRAEAAAEWIRHAQTGVSNLVGRVSEAIAVRRDGTEFPVEMAITALGEGDRVSFHAFQRDISARTAAEADLVQYRQLVRSSQDAMGVVDLDGKITAWNPAAEALFGYTEAEVVGQPFTTIVPPQAVEQMREWFDAATGGQSVSYTQQHVRKDGSLFTVSARMDPIRDPDGTVTGVFVVGRDVTEALAAQEQLARAAAIVSSSQDGIVAVDLDGKVILWNPAMAAMFGLPPAEAIGRSFTDFAPPEDAAQISGAVDAAFAGQTVSYVARRAAADGSPLSVSMQLAPIRDVGGMVVGVCADIRDVSEQEQAEAAAHAAQTQLSAIIDNTSAAISLRDRDFRFLLTNRAFREHIGLPPDTPLTGRLDTEVLPVDVIARRRVSDQRVLAGEPITVEETVTIGGEQSTTLSQRFPLTDAAGHVYAIAEVATDITERKRTEDGMRERIAWEEHISRAVNEGRLLVYAQPIIDLATGELWGEELLVRMHGEHGPGDVVEPDDFLPQAERFGLMPIIDRFMLGEALKLASTGRRISVNVSATSIRTPALTDQVIAQVVTAPQAAPNLTFEITETAALASPGAAQYFSACIAALGAGLALDDFGTGYGSLTELRTLKLTTLKIDLSFVRNLATSIDDQRVVKLVIHIAKTFGITTTAEGVETPEALDLLREYGADRAQGYLIGKPAPVQP